MKHRSPLGFVAEFAVTVLIIVLTVRWAVAVITPLIPTIIAFTVIGAAVTALVRVLVRRHRW